MYRVLIVDDEEPVLDSYAFMLDSLSQEFSLVGKARSGFEALRLIRELKPDVVFMDINIPGMDGIEVISEVHEKNPQIVFILSTAYERFDLAQRAIPLGIFAYLVKPVSKKMFLSTLNSVRTALEKRESPLLTEPSADVAERRFLKEAMWEKMSEDEWARWRGLLGLHSDRGIVCLVELEEDRQQWCGTIASKLSFRHRCLFTIHLNRGIYLISEDVKRDHIARELEDIIKSTVPESIFSAFAVGTPQQGRDLYMSCEEAQSELRRKRTDVDRQLRERLRIIQIRRKIGIQDKEKVRQLFTEFWEEIFASSDFTMAKGKMTAFFTLLLDSATGYYSGPSEEEMVIYPAEEIMPLESISEWEAWSEHGFDKIYDLFARQRAGNFPLPLVKAIAYIQERYTEQIQLTDTAEAAQVSTAYLSRLFSEHLRTNFIDFITELRIEKAEKLIRERRMTIKEISYAVGYQDPNYFSKLFRKMTGLPPTVYAAENRLKEEEL